MRTVLLGLLLALAAASQAFAIAPDEMLKDPALEARARHIGQSLRCLVCQNESIEDSEAGLARDLRAIVRERVTAGDSDRAVVDYVVSRYGQFVLLRPCLEPETWVLWFGPALLVAGAGAAIVLRARRKRSIAEAPLSPDEAAAVARLIDPEAEQS
jgi:cytochrome c-type biogenesis protein CcmH